MRKGRLIPIMIIFLVFALVFISCGEEEPADTAPDDVSAEDAGAAGTTPEDAGASVAPGSADAPWAGVWSIATENGSPPAALGYDSITLTLTGSTFTSTYDGTAGNCTWGGGYTSTPTTMTWATESATGPPCDQALGESRTAEVTVSGDGNTLTLDWTATPLGTLQVYERVS